MSEAQQHAMLLSNTPLNLHSTVHFKLAKKITQTELHHWSANFVYTMYIFLHCQVLIMTYLNNLKSDDSPLPATAQI